MFCIAADRLFQSLTVEGMKDLANNSVLRRFLHTLLAFRKLYVVLSNTKGGRIFR